MTGRRDTNGYFNGRFVRTGARKQNTGGWNDGYQMIVNSISRVASGVAYSQDPRFNQTGNSKVRIEDAEQERWERNTFDNELPVDGQAPTANNKSVRFDSYRAPRRP
jgi:hypothetical protein